MVSLHTKDGDLHRPPPVPRQWPLPRPNITLSTFRAALQKRQIALAHLNRLPALSGLPADAQTRVLAPETAGKDGQEKSAAQAPTPHAPKIGEIQLQRRSSLANVDVKETAGRAQNLVEDLPDAMDVDTEPDNETCPRPPDTPPPSQSDKKASTELADASGPTRRTSGDAEAGAMEETMDLPLEQERDAGQEIRSQSAEGNEKTLTTLKILPAEQTSQPESPEPQREEKEEKEEREEKGEEAEVDWEARNQAVKKRKGEVELLLDGLQKKKHRLVQKLKEVLMKEEETRRKNQGVAQGGGVSPGCRPALPQQHSPAQPATSAYAPSQPFSPSQPAGSTQPPPSAAPQQMAEDDSEREEGELEPGQSSPPMTEEEITPPASPAATPAKSHPSLERASSMGHSSGGGRAELHYGGQGHGLYLHPSTPMGAMSQPMTPGGRHPFSPQAGWQPPRMAQGPYTSSLSGSLSPPPMPMGARQMSPGGGFRGPSSPHLGGHPYALHPAIQHAGHAQQQQGRGLGLGLGHGPHGPIGLPGAPGSLGTGPGFGGFGSPGGMHPHNIHGGRPSLGSGPHGPPPGAMSPSLGPRPIVGMRFQGPWNMPR